MNRRRSKRGIGRLALAALLAALAGLGARAEEVRAPDPGGSPLGRWHLWAKFAQADFQDDAVVVWGVDQATHVGLGVAVFWVEGDEVTYVDGEEWASPLASFGVGVHLFGELTWRVNRWLLGVDAKYQSAGDWLYLDYSNVRFGVHLGVAF